MHNTWTTFNCTYNRSAHIYFAMHNKFLYKIYSLYIMLSNKTKQICSRCLSNRLLFAIRGLKRRPVQFLVLVVVLYLVVFGNPKSLKMDDFQSINYKYYCGIASSVKCKVEFGSKLHTVTRVAIFATTKHNNGRNLLNTLLLHPQIVQDCSTKIATEMSAKNVEIRVKNCPQTLILTNKLLTLVNQSTIQSAVASADKVLNLVKNPILVVQSWLASRNMTVSKSWNVDDIKGFVSEYMAGVTQVMTETESVDSVIVDTDMFESSPQRELSKIARFLAIDDSSDLLLIYDVSLGRYCPLVNRKPYCLAQPITNQHIFKAEDYNKMLIALSPLYDQFCASANNRFQWCNGENTAFSDEIFKNNHPATQPRPLDIPFLVPALCNSKGVMKPNVNYVTVMYGLGNCVWAHAVSWAMARLLNMTFLRDSNTSIHRATEKLFALNLTTITGVIETQQIYNLDWYKANWNSEIQCTGAVQLKGWPHSWRYLEPVKQSLLQYYHFQSDIKSAVDHLINNIMQQYGIMSRQQMILIHARRGDLLTDRHKARGYLSADTKSIHQFIKLIQDNQLM